MDPAGLVQGALAPLQRARDAIEGVAGVKNDLRRRYGDYSSILESLQTKHDVIAAYGIERELCRLTELFTKVAGLIGEYTAAPADGMSKKFSVKAKRAAYCEDVNKQLNEIDREVMRQLAILNYKGAISLSEMEVLQAVDEKVDRLTSLVEGMCPPSLPDMAAIPAAALALPRSYVERPGVREAVDDLVNPEKALAPYTVVGMGGSGKTVLTSAVVREPRVRDHFRGGIFWVRVGPGAKGSLLSLLQGLTREIGAAPTDTPHGVPHVLDSLDQVKYHLATVFSKGTSPRLIVLDDVWEREVVDALLGLEVKVLVTTRDHRVVGVPGGQLELGDMTEDEAVELLLKTTEAAGQPGNDVRTQMAKVVTRCGHLPLALAIAGSIPVVKGKGLVADAWKELIKLFENTAKMMRARGEQSFSISMILEASFNALSETRQEEVLKTAVLAAGAIASVEMLLNLWDTKDTEGTREAAGGLVGKCLLQDVGGGGYRVHDLVLEFVKLKIKADAEMVTHAAALQAQYLARLDVLKSYEDPEHGFGDQGLFFLGALWRSVETLSGDVGLEIASYRASLGELESCEVTTEVADSYARVGYLFKLQGKYAEAGPLYERCQAMQEKVLGSEHRNLASTLNNRARLLYDQGKYTEAEPLYGRCQAIQEKALGPEHPHLAETLRNRAVLLTDQGKFAEAEPIYERCQAIEEKVLGPEHPSLASTLNDRAGLLQRQGKYAEAGSLYERCQAIQEKVLGPEHPSLATTLHNRAHLLQSQGKYAEAGSLYERCQAIQEKVLGPEHPSLATTLHNRAHLLQSQGKYAEAGSLYERCQAIQEKVLGPEHPSFAETLHNRAQLLQSQGKYAEAGSLYERCQAIDEKVLGPEHPSLATTLHNRAQLFADQGKYAEAGSLYERCQAIQEKVLGPEHPSLATTLHNRAQLLQSQSKYAEAGSLYERCQAIQEKVLGPEHPSLATTLHNRARLLQSQGNHIEAIPLLERALFVRRKTLGDGHESTVNTLNRLERARNHVGDQATF